MDAFERTTERTAKCNGSRERLEWLAPSPPRIGMCVRDADGARIGAIVDLVIGESGALIAVGIACVRPAIVKHIAPATLRTYGDGLVCCFFRAEVERFS